MIAVASLGLRDALRPKTPLELAGVRLDPQERSLCARVTRDLASNRIRGIQPYQRPPSKDSLRFKLPHFEQRRAWASRRMLLPRKGGVAAHLRYYREATSLPHPLRSVTSDLPPDLKAAVEYVVSKGANVSKDRDARLAWLQRHARSLDALNARVIALMPSHVKAAAGGMHLALVSCMIDALPGYPDRHLVSRFAHGFPAVGTVEDSGMFRLIPEDERVGGERFSEVFEYRSNLSWIAHLEADMAASGVGASHPKFESSRAAYMATLEECVGDVTTWGVRLSKEEALRTGRSHRGFSKEELDRHPWLQAPGHSSARGRWRPIRRFAVWQNGKWRPCDHARESLHNACTRPAESLAGQASAERPAELSRAFADAHGKPVPMHGGTEDWPKAYRRSPVLDPRFNVVAVWNPFEHRTEYFLLAGFNFGLLSAVCAYNRWPRFAVSAARCWLGCCVDSYFDDCFVGEPQYAGGSGQRAMGLFVAMLGTPFAPVKHEAPSELPTFLGVVTDLSRVASHGEMSVSIKQSRKDSIRDLAESILRAGCVTGSQASKLTGKARWMLCPCFGKIGIAVLQPLYKVGIGATVPLSTELSESVQAIRVLADSMPPRVVPVQVSSEPPTVVFTDAAFEGGNGTIGVVVKRPGHNLAWTACDCPGWVFSAFQAVDRAKEQYIGQLELLAAVVAYTTFPDLLAGQHVIHWIDNESAVYSLVKGYCGAADSARVVNVFHSAMCRLGVTPWLEYVGTEDNIADLPSRGEFGLLYTLGGPDSFRSAVLPPASSFTGLLEPLGGFRPKCPVG